MKKAVGSRPYAVGSLVLLLVLVCAGGVAIAHQQQAPQRTPAQEGFVPVDTLPSAKEQLPAAPLVMGFTFVRIVWIALFSTIYLLR